MTGSDVAGSRPYHPGDDMRTIDWNASAKLSAARSSDEFLVREHYAEEAPRVVIVCDRRPEMELFPDELPWLSKPDRDARGRPADRRQRPAGPRPARLPRLRRGRRRAVLARRRTRSRTSGGRRRATSGPAFRAPDGQRDARAPPPDRRAPGAAGRNLRLPALGLHRAARRGGVGPGRSSCPGTSCRS